MFLLAIVAAAILPAMWGGIRVSAQQSSVATATRAINALIEQARSTGTCAAIQAAAATPASPTVVHDGRGLAISISGVFYPDGSAPGSACSGGGTLMHLNLTATDAFGTTLHTATSIIYTF
jgi:type II secretory pathway pseudopilin PulG